jgi:sortase A
VKLAKALAAIGRTMITAGVLILLFVVYQLWGTGFHTSREQDNANEVLEQQAEEAGVELPPEPTEDHREPVTRRQRVPHAPPHGQPIGWISIPAIDLNRYAFFEGVDLPTLQKGPGHYEGTPLPGEPGNAGIAGHRTTYLHPFNRIDELGDGDQIIIEYAIGSSFTYEYLNTNIVTPDRTDVLESKFDDRITLTACHPKYSAAERIVVSARLIDRPARPRQNPQTTGPVETPRSLNEEGIDGQDHAKTPAVVWGIAAAMVWLTAWVIGRAWRRWPMYAVGLPVFLIMLYGFFENFSYLLPSSY